MTPGVKYHHTFLYPALRAPPDAQKISDAEITALSVFLDNRKDYKIKWKVYKTKSKIWEGFLIIGPVTKKKEYKIKWEKTATYFFEPTT